MFSGGVSSQFVFCWETEAGLGAAWSGFCYSILGENAYSINLKILTNFINILEIIIFLLYIIEVFDYRKGKPAARRGRKVMDPAERGRQTAEIFLFSSLLCTDFGIGLPIPFFYAVDARAHGQFTCPVRVYFLLRGGDAPNTNLYLTNTLSSAQN